MTHELAGRRVLLVEDEMLVAMDMEATLTDAGCVVVGPFGRLDQAMAAAVEGEMDLALLDVNLRGDAVFPVADVLAARNIPFAFLTGCGRESLPPRYGARGILSKPFRPEALTAALKAMVAEAAP